jgi:hypothetical protein
MPTLGATGRLMKRIIWMIPSLIVAHNVEEAVSVLFIGSTFMLPEPLQRLVGNITVPQFMLALSIVTFLSLSLYALYLMLPEKKIFLRLMFLMQSTMFINVFSHLGGVVITNRYVPGLATALLINLPFSVYFASGCIREGLVSKRAIIAYLVGAVIVHSVGILELMKIAGWLVHKVGSA